MVESTIFRSLLSMDASTDESIGKNKNTQEISEKPPIISALESIDADVFVYAGKISAPFDREMMSVIADVPTETKSSTCILILDTLGGIPDAAYTIARSFQRAYETFIVAVPSYCKSSGTLICLGADKIIMSDAGELGPLDIQVSNKEEFGESLSGLNPSEALQALSSQAIELLRSNFLDLRLGGGLSTRQALEVSTNLTGQLMSPITAQLDIMKYGEFIRAMRIAEDYGERLQAHCSNGGNLRSQALKRLTQEYSSHGFCIDREEASKHLFKNVSEPDFALDFILKSMRGFCDNSALGSSGPIISDLKKEFGLYQQIEEEDGSVSMDASEANEKEEVNDDQVNANEQQKSRSKSTNARKNVRSENSRSSQKSG